MKSFFLRSACEQNFLEDLPPHHYSVKNHCLTLILILFLMGCNSIATPVITPSQPPATTLTITPSPTKDIKAPTSTPNYSATNDPIYATFTAVIQAVMATGQPETYESHPSPDGKWIVEIITYDCVRVNPNPNADLNAYEELRLIEVSSGQEKSVFDQLQTCGALGSFGLKGLFWSANGRYFYYTDSREGVPDGCDFWEEPILRLEPAALEAKYLGRGPLSPDGTKIAAWQDKDLIIWDLSQGDRIGQVRAFAPEMDAGFIAWSPDGQALAYTQSEYYCPHDGNSSVIQVNLSTLKQTRLLESKSPSFGRIEWKTQDELTLFDEGGRKWIYVFHLHEIRPLP